LLSNSPAAGSSFAPKSRSPSRSRRSFAPGRTSASQRANDLLRRKMFPCHSSSPISGSK
jgi:hypothetical protein